MGVHKAIRRSHWPTCVVCDAEVERVAGLEGWKWVHADTGSQYAPNPPEMEALMRDAEAAAERLEYLRGELRAERISWGEVAELQSLARFIDPGDVELLEAAGVPEGQQANADAPDYDAPFEGEPGMGAWPKPAAPMIVDAYGNLWPANFIVCQKCGQPDNCGDCNHGRLTPDEVRQLGGTPA